MRLGSIITDTNAGKSPQCSDRPKGASEWGVIKTTSIQDGFFLADENKVLPKGFAIQGNQVVTQGDLLITRAGPRNRTGVLCVVDQSVDKLILSDKTVRLAYMLGYVEPHYLMYAISSPLIQQSVIGSMSGMAASQVNISQSKMKGWLVPLPPLDEQGRICRAINMVAPLMVDYGALEDARERLDAELPDRLRKSILQLAVQGKLVPQDPADEPASVLLDHIRAERARLIKEKRIRAPKGGESIIYRASDGGYYEKRGKGVPVCIDDEIPFEIPENWAWARMSTLIELLSGVDLASSQYNDRRKGVPYLTGASNFDNGSLIENRWTEQPKRVSVCGDLLFTCKGTVGAMAVNTFEEAHIARQIMAVKPIDAMTLDYIEVFLMSMVESIKSQAKGVIPGIERNNILDALVPLPSAGEQRRIVESVDNLLRMFG